jgi:hypothetical protein
VIPARPAKVIDPRFDYLTKDAHGDTKAVRLVKSGRIIPHGPRLLVRCIMPDEASSFDSGARDAKNALAFEVIAMGAGCEVHYKDAGIPIGGRIRVGDHIQTSIAVVDRLNKDAADTLFYTLPLDMVDAFWEPVETFPDPRAD